MTARVARGLGGASTALVSDVLGALGLPSAPLRGVAPVAAGSRIAGRARTVRYAPVAGDHPFWEAPHLVAEVVLDAAVGDVLVIDACGASLAFWGDELSALAADRGLEGVVLDGAVRDLSGVRDGLPVFAGGRTPQTCLGRYEAVARDVPVRCGDVEVAPGDVVVGDDDGVLVVPAAAAGAVGDAVERLLGDRDAPAPGDPRASYRALGARWAALAPRPDRRPR